MPNPGLLRRPALRREAQSTSALEGTFAPIEAVLEPDVEERGRLPLEVKEILNFVVAAEEAFGWIRERRITVGLIGDLQRILVQGTPGEYSDAGGPRDRQAIIGPRDASIEDARFIPAPFGDHLQAGFEQWVDWVNEPPTDVSAVVQAALAHYQFETLHSFSDGNGRIGRLLIVLQFMRLVVLVHPILVVSPWFEHRRQEYQDELLDLSRTGDWNRWVKFFATGIAAAATGTHERVNALLSWQDTAISQVRQSGAAGIAERVAGELIGQPILNAGHVARRHDISHQGAMNALRRLRDLGIVTEQIRNGRVTFVATRAVELLSR